MGKTSSKQIKGLAGQLTGLLKNKSFFHINQKIVKNILCSNGSNPIKILKTPYFFVFLSAKTLS